MTKIGQNLWIKKNDVCTGSRLKNQSKITQKNPKNKPKNKIFLNFLKIQKTLKKHTKNHEKKSEKIHLYNKGFIIISGKT